MLIDTTKKFIFIHIPKTAGTSIRETLKMSCDDYLEELDNDLEKRLFRKSLFRHRRLRVIMNSKYSIDKNFKDYYKFAFVRNPWDRTVSKFHYYKDYGDKIIKAIPNLTEKMSIYMKCSFDEFVSLHSPQYRSKYWNLQHNQMDYIVDSKQKVDVDFIGRYENLQNDYDTICNTIGIPKIQLSHNNKSNHKHYSEYYTEETKAIIGRVFKKDIKVFGYEFEDGEDRMI